MPVAFPSLTPSSMELTLAGRRIATGAWQGIWETPAVVGSLPVEPTLEITFANRTTAEAAAVLTTWRATAGGTIRLAAPLPAALVAGVLYPALASYLRNPPGLVWRIRQPPRHQAVKKGRATVQVSLVAELR